MIIDFFISFSSTFFGVRSLNFLLHRKIIFRCALCSTMYLHTLCLKKVLMLKFVLYYKYTNGEYGSCKHICCGLQMSLTELKKYTYSNVVLHLLGYCM